MEFKKGDRIYINKPDSAIHGKKATVKGWSEKTSLPEPHYDIEVDDDKESNWCVLQKDISCMVLLTNECICEYEFCKGFRFDFYFCKKCGCKKFVNI